MTPHAHFRLAGWIRLAGNLLTLPLLALPAVAEEDCLCTLKGPIEVSNFPSVQHVVLKEPVPVVTVRETDLTRTVVTELSLIAGEKRVIGPFPLEGRSRLTIQASLLQPSTGTPQPPLTLKWLVRFHADDPFFDPCGDLPGEACRIGFPGAGVRLRMAPPSRLAPIVDHQPVTPALVSIASTSLEGVEGLLVADNTGGGARTVRVQAVFNR